MSQMREEENKKKIRGRRRKGKKIDFPKIPLVCKSHVRGFLTDPYKI